MVPSMHVRSYSISYVVRETTCREPFIPRLLPSSKFFTSFVQQLLLHFLGFSFLISALSCRFLCLLSCRRSSCVLCIALYYILYNVLYIHSFLLIFCSTFVISFLLSPSHCPYRAVPKIKK